MALKRKAVHSPGYPADVTDMAPWSHSQLKSAGILMAKLATLSVDLAEVPNTMAKALSMRDRFLMAVVNGDPRQASLVQKNLNNLGMDRQTIAATGWPRLLHDRAYWRGIGAFESMSAQALRPKARYFEDIQGKFPHRRILQAIAIG